MNQAGYKAPARGGGPGARGGRRGRDGGAGRGGSSGAWTRLNRSGSGGSANAPGGHPSAQTPANATVSTQSSTQGPTGSNGHNVAGGFNGSVGSTDARSSVDPTMDAQAAANSQAQLEAILEQARGKRAVVRMRNGDLVRGILQSAETGPLQLVIENAVHVDSRGRQPPGNLVLGVYDVMDVELEGLGRHNVAGTFNSKNVPSLAPSARSGGRQSKSPARSPSAKTSSKPDAKSPDRGSGHPVPSGPASSKLGFRTDTDISKQGAFKTQERELERWTDDGLGEDVGTLDDMAPGQWDQFAANRKIFGVESTYDEHFYTTAIDKSHPEFAERQRRADQLAREIEGQAHNGNVHLAEERGIVVDDSGLDEEDKYSGVQRGSKEADTQTTRPQDPAILYSSPGQVSTEASKPHPNALVTNVPTGQGRTFEQFVASEAQAAAKDPAHYAEHEKYDRIHDFRQFSAEYKISSPIPPDLVPILGRKSSSNQASTVSDSSETSSPTVAKTGSSTASAAPKKKFNFSAAAAKAGAFSFKPPAATTQAASTPVVAEVTPKVKEPTPVLNGTPRPIDGMFDYIVHLREENANVPNAFYTPPTWSATNSESSYRDQFPPPVPMPVPVMPYGYMYQQQQVVPQFIDPPNSP